MMRQQQLINEKNRKAKLREQIEQKKNLVEIQKERQKAQEEMINVANDEAMREQNLKQLQTKAEI